ncbi:HipA domain-containing protein [Listeria booriae]|uniref:HipA domain-containing protein n=1 Tax=Listeria booriae TaxID=1552123 RepID=A0A7X0YN36_9LIST|nr:HipA family kinase [Listeria booriae]MBC2036119.1 HipA domain-containing protein [Listeria booriae]MBC2117494.1 HipA domain-containing protein [Listeria booriae]MBC2162536.1 HipA domain-containing protein [Listeria booriae]MBC6165200.1 HipA domain-containing protein [Listeria booriae]
MEVIQPLSFVSKIKNGKTFPFKVHTANGEYIVKAINEDFNYKGLINEFICYNLAKLLNLPIPDATLMEINEEFISDNETLFEVVPNNCIAFASKYTRGNPSITPPLLNRLVNKEDIPGIILFDQIIYNNDRAANRGNLIISKTGNLLIIDHSHVFKDGLVWSSNSLHNLTTSPITLVDSFDGQNYTYLQKYVNGHSPFNKILEGIEKLSPSDIDLCFSAIPNEWLQKVSDEEIHHLKIFLCHRLDKKDAIIELLKNKCPNWKGGVLND